MGRPISVPVGDQVMGHVFNSLGECLDEPDLEITGELWGIHRQAPSFDKSSPASSNTEVPYREGNDLISWISTVDGRAARHASAGGAVGPDSAPRFPLSSEHRLNSSRRAAGSPVAGRGRIAVSACSVAPIWKGL